MNVKTFFQDFLGARQRLHVNIIIRKDISVSNSYANCYTGGLL